jgi:hypothetical protein
MRGMVNPQSSPFRFGLQGELVRRLLLGQVNFNGAESAE